jgi:DNA-binding transcriptional MerR regulator
MNIKEVAKLTGITAYTLRYYDKLGLLQHIHRNASGARDFSEGDIRYITFITSLKKTGMSLNDIMHFMEDGCIVERVNQGIIPSETISNRIALLLKQKESLLERKAELDILVDAVSDKINFYSQLLDSKDVPC